jgi:hypothetical protein
MRPQSSRFRPWTGMPIAASVTEGPRVKAGDPESFGSAWLD